MNYEEKNTDEIPQRKLMKDAKKALSGKWNIVIPTALVFLMIVSGNAVIPFAGIIIGGPLVLGFSIFSLKLARKEEVELNDLFDGFKDFERSLLAYFLMVLIVCVGTVFFIIPGIILALGLSQTMFILADDPEIDAVDALKKSWEMMRGHKTDLFVLGLRFIPLAFLCIFTLGIGFLWLIPYIQVTYANFYNAVRYGDHTGYNDGFEHHLVV